MILSGLISFSQIVEGAFEARSIFQSFVALVPVHMFPKDILVPLPWWRPSKALLYIPDDTETFALHLCGDLVPSSSRQPSRRSYPRNFSPIHFVR